jgi:hypothetical protein
VREREREECRERGRKTDDEMGSPPHVFGFASKKKKENLK